MPPHPSGCINTQVNPTSHHPVRTTDIRQPPLGLFDIKVLYSAPTQERLVRRLAFKYEKYEKYITVRLSACFAAAGHPAETSYTTLDLYNERQPRKSPGNAGGLRQPGPLSTWSAWTSSTSSMPVGVLGGVGYWLDEVTVSKIDV